MPTARLACETCLFRSGEDEWCCVHSEPVGAELAAHCEDYEFFWASQETEEEKEVDGED